MPVRCAEDYIQHQHGNPLLDIPGWRLEMCRGDIMRNAFLGAGPHAVANVIAELAEEGFWGA
eukprot:13557242-Alexandrium_andersonii.AAC.1